MGNAFSQALVLDAGGLYQVFEGGVAVNTRAVNTGPAANADVLQVCSGSGCSGLGVVLCGVGHYSSSFKTAARPLGL